MYLLGLPGSSFELDYLVSWLLFNGLRN